MIVTALLGCSIATLPPDYDAFYDAPETDAIGATLNAAELFDARRGQISGTELRVGVPTFFWAPSGVHAPEQSSVEGAARAHLERYAGLYRTTSEATNKLVWKRTHDTGEGVVIVSFGGEVGGVPVFRDEVRVAMKRDYALVAISGFVTPRALAWDSMFAGYELTPEAAISMASVDLLGSLFSPSDFSPSKRRASWRWFDAPDVEGPFGAVFPEQLRVRRVVFATPDSLRPAFHVELVAQRDDHVSSRMFGYVIDGADGRVLFRRNLTEHDAYSYRVYAEPNLPHRPYEGPQGDAWLPHPVGEFTPFQTQTGTASLVTLESGPISTNDPWLPNGATETVGNNVDAYADLFGPDGLNDGDFRAVSTSSNTFDYPHDITAEPAANMTQQQAAIVQIFFINNYLHDWFYDRGFDESAGNAQADNFGRGGEEEDSLRAEVQDYSGSNNANMSTRADGARPRMQMYIWSARSHASIDVDAVSSLAGSHPAGTARFGPSDVEATGTLAIIQDADGNPLDGCSPYTNTASVAGRIALVMRGNCNFFVKTDMAEQAGALGVVLTNNVFSWIPNDMNNSNSTSMAMVSVTRDFGDTLRAEIANGANIDVTIRAVGRAAKDSAMDAVVVTHEWAHYISNRLVGNASGLSQVQARGMGEGWSDFFGLLMSVTEDDQLIPANTNWRGSFGVGTNSSYKNPYFGIRRVPYTVDFSRNALTFSMIENGVALPASVPTASGLNGASNAEVHRTGEVWSTMLWECYVALLTDSRLTFDEAQDRMARYLVAGLKLTPNAPTFVEARDGILAAAYANDPVDFELLYRAFARRGIGLGAEAPPRTNRNNSPVVESFAIGNAVDIVDITLDDENFYCDRDGVVDSGEIGRLRVWLKNTGITSLDATSIDVTSGDPRVSFPSGSQIMVPSFEPFATVETVLPVALNGSTEIHEIDLQIVVGDPSLVLSATVAASTAFRVHTDIVSNSTTTDDVEAANSPWLATVDTSLARGQECERVRVTASNHRWFCPDVGTPADLYLTSLPMVVSTTGSLNVAFDHRYDIEDTWDGAIVELTEDGGMSWIDIGQLAQPPYDSTLRADTPNPLEGRDAWTGNNPSYPGLDRVTIDLADTYRGQTIQVRFRAGSDTAAAGVGWEIDNITVDGVDTPPFPALIADQGLCINRPPIADAGPDLVVDEGSMVMLDSSGTSDVDGDQLVLAWAQLSGPTITLGANDDFVAPFVDEDTTFVFQLTALDATLAGTDTVEVIVIDSNRAVIVDAGPTQNVDEAVDVTLAGTATDPDGDMFTIEWQQIAGPTVVLSATDVLTPSFTSPNTEDGLTLVFELTATEREHVTTDTTTVTVGHVNRPPTVTITAPLEVEAEATVTAEATVNDPDGDTVTIEWRQASGPSVAFDDSTALIVSFAAPMVEENQTIVLEAVASDGTLEAMASASILIKAPETTKTAPDEEGGCSCSVRSTNGSIAPWGLLIGLFVMARRRRKLRS